MTRFKNFLHRLNRPLRAIEYVLPITIIASTVISISESFINSTSEGPGFLSALIEEFEIVSVIFAVLSVFSIGHIFSLVAEETWRTLKIRQYALFSYVVGLSFVGVLSMAHQGPLALLWINMLALSTVSTILYLNLRVILNERQR